jgi:glycosyltransferase involved in cell wall biosynthesis
MNKPPSSATASKPVQNPGLSVVVPVYNEGKRIGAVLSGLIEVLEGMDLAWEVLVVDDGSTDDTATAVGLSRATLLRHRRNNGYGAALKTGMRMARYDYVLWFDGDGQHTAGQIPEFVAALDEGADVVIGVRKLRHSFSLLRIAGKAVIWKFGQIILGTTLPDLNCGFRAFRRNVITRYLHLLPNRYSASITSTLVLFYRGYTMETIRVRFNNNGATSHFCLLRDGLRAVNQLLRMAMLFNPWRLFGFTGIILVALGAGYGIWSYLVAGSFISSATMLIIAGLQSLFFGLIMDQIAEIRKGRFED